MSFKNLYTRLECIFNNPVNGRFYGLIFLWFSGAFTGLLVEGFDIYLSVIPFFWSLLGIYPWVVFFSLSCCSNAANFPYNVLYGIPFVIALISFIWFFIEPTFKKYIIGTSMLYYIPIMHWFFQLYYFIF